ncbi:hypothetical protein KKF84_03375 [Myxococcota bacterium]|nr:hypothetical protein [Myxococcota bacterium]
MSSFVITLLILAVGATIGSIPIKGFYLESMGLLLTGMVFGWFGHTVHPVFVDLGVAFFIYGIALQIGPGFIESFKRDGLGFSLIALSVSIAGMVAALVVGKLLGVPGASLAGVYSGAYNSALALIPALNANGVDAAKAFGLVYPFSFMAVMFFTALVPKLTRVNVPEEVSRFHDEQNKKYPPMVTKSFSVMNPGVVNRTLRELDLTHLAGITLVRILRDGKLISPNPEVELQLNDIVEIAGTESQIMAGVTVLGSEKEQVIPHRTKKRFMADRRILITNKSVIGIPLNRLMLQERFGATVTRIRRGGLNLPVSPHSVLLYGDKVTVVARKNTLAKLTVALGNDIQSFGKQEFFPVFIGMAIGGLLGSIPMFGGFSIGVPGGILIAGIAAGRAGRVGPVIFTMSPQSNHDLKRLGLMLFMAALGTASGKGLAQGITIQGVYAAITGVIAILASLLAALFIGRKILKKNIIDVLAITTGSIACTPALEMSNNMTGQESSAITYAAIYPMGLMAPLLVTNLLLWILTLL